MAGFCFFVYFWESTVFLHFSDLYVSNVCGGGYSSEAAVLVLLKENTNQKKKKKNHDR